MRKLLLLFLSLLIAGAYGCAVHNTGGSVNYDVRDYQALMKAGDIKKVDYYCNFEKIAGGDMEAYGDYCLKADNEDYVSRYVSFDVQSTNVYRNHLVQMVAMVSMEKGGAWQLKYYQIFSLDDYDKLMVYDIEPAQPTSFTLLDDDGFQIIISKADLLARRKIYPELTVHSLKSDVTPPASINDFNIKYQIAPYIYNIKYSDPLRGRLLGLPDYQVFAGKYDSVKEIQINRYAEELDKYWKNPTAYKYDPAKATVVDFAIPQLGREKFSSDNVPTDIRPRPVSPYVYEGLLNDYLPSYVLDRVEIVYIDTAGVEKVAKTFTNDDIMNVLVSYEDHSALVYGDTPVDGWVAIRFIHKAQPPAVSGLKPVTAEQLGIGYIYSDIGTEIHTSLYVERFYQINKLPRACVNDKEFISSMIDAGYAEEDALNVLSGMDPAPFTKCTPAQTSIGEMLPYIIK